MARRSKVFHRVAERLQDAGPQDRHAQHAVDVLGEFGYENVAVLLIDEACGDLVPHALSRRATAEETVEDERRVRAHGPRVGVGLTGWTARTGESVRVGDVHADERYSPLREAVRSELCVPLKLDRGWAGVLNVESTRRHAYTRGDQQLLETVGTTISLAIRHDRLTAVGESSSRDAWRARAEQEVVPVCSMCKKIRTRNGLWRTFEAYFRDRDAIEFTHGFCPACLPRARDY